MQISKDPLAPLRAWKELLFGERALKAKRSWRARRRSINSVLANPHVPTAE
jgi:hypothetical protein